MVTVAEGTQPVRGSDVYAPPGLEALRCGCLSGGPQDRLAVDDQRIAAATSEGVHLLDLCGVSR